MFDMIRNFVDDTKGAVTVDFVVLTGAIVLLGFVVVSSFSGSTTALANDISSDLNGI